MQSFVNFLPRRLRTPISRIVIASAVVTFTAGCTKLGSGNPAAPSGPPAPGSAIVYTAIGASDANGVGSSLTCLPYDDACPGLGYVPVTSRQLRAQGFTVTQRNLGIPTTVIAPDFQRLGLQYGHTVVGNFLDEELPFLRSDTTLVTVFAGGNEVNIVTGALDGGAGAGDQAGYIDNQVSAFRGDYAAVMLDIASRASARIILLNVPNLAGLPMFAGVSLQQKQAAQRAAVGMTTTVVNPLAAQNVAVVDLMCDPRTYLASNYSSDGFHPNDAGYAYIASEVVKAATSSYPAPNGSCAQMSMVPSP